MLSLSDISVSFGKRKLFENVSFVINRSERTGLVGTNGSGKSTLLKIIAGILKPDQGNISSSAFTTIGYLPQDGIFTSSKTLFQEVYSSAENLTEISRKISEITESLKVHKPSSQFYKELIEELGELHFKYESQGGFELKSKTEEILEGLGFNQCDFQRNTSEFSGGWLMRIALAKLLLNQPSILLLDEPTNHLDIDSLLWLENFLLSYRGAVIIVSHDIKFLDNITNRTIEIFGGKISQYNGNYSFYSKEKKKQEENLIKLHKNQQKYINQQKKFIERFRYKASKASSVQSRIKMLEKIEIVQTQENESHISFILPSATRSAKKVIELINIAIGYGENIILQNVNLEIERGEKIGLLGKNGEGKSTLASVISGLEKPKLGTRIQGENVIIEYYSQNVADTLDPENTVLGTLDSVAEKDIRKHLRTILGSFLFRGDDVFKKVSVLSGGEKSRLALARMLLRSSNFLILDEPTNHLDVVSKKVLSDAIKKYEGTVLLISHDRDFLDSIVTKIIEVKNKSIKIYPGNFSYYLTRKTEEQIKNSDYNKPENKLTNHKKLKLAKRIEAEKRNNLYRATRELKEKITELEKEISIKEEKLKNLENRMNDFNLYKNSYEVKKASHEYKKMKEELDQLYRNWHNQSEKLEDIIANHKN